MRGTPGQDFLPSENLSEDERGVVREGEKKTEKDKERRRERDRDRERGQERAERKGDGSAVDAATRWEVFGYEEGRETGEWFWWAMGLRARFSHPGHEL